MITGVILAVAVLLFLRPLLSLFGATTDVMPMRWIILESQLWDSLFMHYPLEEIILSAQTEAPHIL